MHLPSIIFISTKIGIYSETFIFLNGIPSSYISESRGVVVKVSDY